MYEDNMMCISLLAMQLQGQHNEDFLCHTICCTILRAVCKLSTTVLVHGHSLAHSSWNFNDKETSELLTITVTPS